MRFETIIFDLDGTILNTLGDLKEAVNYALSKRGYPARTEDEVRAFVGNGVGQLIARALPAAAAGEAADCLADFRAYYGQHLMDKTVPYEGVPALVSALRAEGIALCVLSNKYDAAAKALVQHFFGDAFEVVLGEREGVPRKPDPAAVHEILAACGVPPRRALYVGDSGVDMQTAKNAGLFALGVTWGFRAREVLLESGADALIDRPEELFALLQKI